MDCNHDRLRTVGDLVFCCGCGAELPLEFLLAKNAPVNAEKPAKKADDKPGTNKAPARKRAAKKAV